MVATRATLFAIGYLWMLAIPLPGLGKDTYIDENALQPSQVRQYKPCSVLFNILYLQVKTYWDWGNVHAADVYLAQLEQIRDANFTNKQSEHPVAWSLSTFLKKVCFLDEPSSSAPNSSN